MFGKIKAWLFDNAVGFYYAYTLSSIAKAAETDPESCSLAVDNLKRYIFGSASDYILFKKEKDDIIDRIDGRPVWLIPVDDEIYQFMGTCYQSNWKLGMIVPVINTVINLTTNEVVGYNLHIPQSFMGNENLKKFAIAHEISHVKLGHLANDFVVLSEESEFESDVEAMKITGFDVDTVKEILIDTYRIGFKTTVENIDSLKKYRPTVDKQIENYIKNSSRLKRRLENIEKYR